MKMHRFRSKCTNKLHKTIDALETVRLHTTCKIRRERENHVCMKHQEEGSSISAQFCKLAGLLDTWTL